MLVIEKYKELFSLNEPIVEITSEYFYDGKINYERKIYDKSANKVEQFLNYSFTDYIISDQTISFNYYFIEKIDDYFIIGLEQATELLLKKEYYSIYEINYPITKDKIAGVQFSYRIDKFTKQIIPFYLFWIDTSDEFINNKYQNLFYSYTAYYVSALTKEDLNNLEPIEFYFN